MKKLLLLTLAIFTLVSCGDSNSKKTEKDKTEKSEKTIKKKIKTLKERKEEGKTARAELSTYLMEIPENLVFSNAIFNASGIKKSSFIAENIDEAAKIKLDDWFKKQSDDLVTASWEKIVLQEDVTVLDLLTNSHSYRKAQGGDSILTDMLSLSTVYDPKRKTYTLHVKPYTI